MDERSKYRWNFIFPQPKVWIFIQKRAIPSLNSIAIQQFSPLKKTLIYRLKNKIVLRSIAPKKNPWRGYKVEAPIRKSNLFSQYMKSSKVASMLTQKW
jgi:hypothetical protein